LEATAIEASKGNANMTESTANAEQKHKEEDARALAMHQAEMGEEETGKFEKMEEAVVALKKQVVEEKPKALTMVLCKMDRLYQQTPQTS
jgi:hypothetical protein